MNPGDCIETNLDEETVVRALTLAYDNLISSEHKPQQSDFRRHAREYKLSDECFNAWARQRRWWIGPMLMEVPARSPEKLVELRKRSIEMVDGHGAPGPQSFTCDECAAAPTCFLAFDWYNTSGDCLAEK